jgi:hypothetical protein
LAWISFAVSGITGVVWRFSKISVNKKILKGIASGSLPVVAVPNLFQRFCYWVSILGFFVGIIALTIFGYMNI